jgi:hypothetical protein
MAELMLKAHLAGDEAGAQSVLRTFAPRNLTAQLADEAGVQSGARGFPFFGNSVTWSYVTFPVVPKRSRTLQCIFYASDYGSEALHPFSKITFKNPLSHNFPQWTAEPVPTIKHVGDLEVRLDELAWGHPVSANILKSNGARTFVGLDPIRGDGTWTDTGIDLSLRSPRGTNELWIPHSVELSDATGNVLSAKTLGLGDLAPARHIAAEGFLPTGWSGFCEFIHGTLWPDEAAWKLKLELKRASGFSAGQVVIFKGVPIPPIGTTNLLSITNTADGMQIVLTKFIRRQDITQTYELYDEMASRLCVELPGKPKDAALDFLDLTTDTGQSLGYYGRSSIKYYGHFYDDDFLVKSIPTNARTVDLTLVLQKTRTVEFLVKPPGAK